MSWAVTSGFRRIPSSSRSRINRRNSRRPCANVWITFHVPATCIRASAKRRDSVCSLNFHFPFIRPPIRFAPCHGFEVVQHAFALSTGIRAARSGGPTCRHVRLWADGLRLRAYRKFSTFVFSDLVRRYLEFKGFQVRHVMNVTDVEDKIIKHVRETGKALREYTSFYEGEFLQDLDKLRCLRPHDLPHATDFIPDIVALIGKLIARGIAYKANDGSVYFSIEKYRGCGCQYGQLVKLNFDEMRVGERVSSDEYDKESVEVQLYEL